MPLNPATLSRKKPPVVVRPVYSLTTSSGDPIVLPDGSPVTVTY